MTAQGFDYVETDGAPIKMWTRGVQVEEQAMQQLRNVASLPFIHKHVAAMPDVHWGMARRSVPSSPRGARLFLRQLASISAAA